MLIFFPIDPSQFIRIKYIVYLFIFSCKYKYINMKRQSSNRDNDSHVPYYDKMDKAKCLMKLIENGRNLRITDFLLGYTLANAEIPLGEPICFELKEKFNNLDELRHDRLINAQNILFIILDAIYIKKSLQYSSQKEQINKFINTLMYNTEEVMINKNYIIEKWRNQDQLLEENHKNELALRNFLEQQKKQLKTRAEEADSQGWECQICCCDIQKNDIGILECGHIFHPQCINGFLKAKIEANEVLLFCPMEECKKAIQIGDIYRFIDGDLKQKFEKFTFNKYIEDNTGSLSWCPTAGCQAAFEFDEMLDNYKCPACSKHYCLKCRCEYHHGMTCAEYRINNRFDKNDEDFIKFVQGAKYKQCPKCKYWVQRNDGCCTMSCKCGQEFCYECGGTSCPHGSCSNSGGIVNAVRSAVLRAPNIIHNLFGGRRKK